MQTKARIRILIADDHPVVRDGLAAILGTQPDFWVVGEAGTGADAVRMSILLEPDILLLDLEMPDLDGVEVLKRLHEANSRSKALVFTAYDTDERILTAIRLGVQGYLLKGSPREEVFHAIRIVAAGGSLLGQAIAIKLIQQAARSGVEKEPPGPGIRLTEREQDVLAGLAAGKTNKVIARELLITERTVKFHVSSILGKLGAGNRTEAVKKAAWLKLIQL